MSFLFNTTDIVSGEARSLGELFHENSKLHPRAGAKLGRWIGNLMESPLSLKTMSRGFKTYPNAPIVKLPFANPPDVSLASALRKRRSVMSGAPGRKFSDAPLSTEEVSVLLRESCGVTEVRHMESHGLRYQQKMRAFPSGGGLYPIEVYPILTNCETPSGLYHYNVPEHAIERLRGPFEESELRRLTSFDGLLESAALILVFSAVFARTYFKYHERGYRFALLEAGHLAENFYLQATAMNLAVVALGGFFDDEVNRALSIDGVDEAAVYAMVFGRPPA
jgi:SagB-type dehydrogenase family enzyme